MKNRKQTVVGNFTITFQGISPSKHIVSFLLTTFNPCEMMMNGRQGYMCLLIDKHLVKYNNIMKNGFSAFSFRQVNCSVSTVR